MEPLFTSNREKCKDPLCTNIPNKWYIYGYCSVACYEVAMKKAEDVWRNRIQQSQVTDNYSIYWHRQYG